ncbi:uncharacterized protein LOC141623769 [Silene latifolia]|uniref:uncharacterized protein LOC141623769 n=1 Tax=Silene latifolia TaxID=37657 RepID=UPI003D786E43
MQNQSMDDHNQVDQLSEITHNLGKTLTLESSFQLEHNSAADDDVDDDDVVYVIDNDDDDDDDVEFEFSFAGEEVKSPVSAEELFDNGKIKPTIPYLAEEAPAVKKVFVVSPAAGEAADEGPYCVWSTDRAEEAAAASSVPEMSRKSNSTGFSRLWRVKDLLVRSNSDGKDTFVFLPGKGTAEAVEKKKKKIMKVLNLTRIKVGGGKSNEGETSSSSSSSNVDGEKKEKAKKGKKASMSVAYEALYGKKKGGDKSYLPYRVGFFTNSNGMTKNVHPY